MAESSVAIGAPARKRPKTEQFTVEQVTKEMGIGWIN